MKIKIFRTKDMNKMKGLYAKSRENRELGGVPAGRTPNQLTPCRWPTRQKGGAGPGPAHLRSMRLLDRSCIKTMQQVTVGPLPSATFPTCSTDRSLLCYTCPDTDKLLDPCHLETFCITKYTCGYHEG